VIDVCLKRRLADGDQLVLSGIVQVTNFDSRLASTATQAKALFAVVGVLCVVTIAGATFIAAGTPVPVFVSVVDCVAGE